MRSICFFFGTSSAADVSELEEISLYTTGKLWELPAGDLGVVVGYETRDQSLPVGALSSIGVPEPTVDYDAWFVEFSVPLVRNADWADSLTMTLSARQDNYASSGAVAAEVIQADFSEISPRIGFSWVINDQVALRGSRGEGFRAPGFSDLFSTSTQSFFLSTFDPLFGFTPAPVEIAFGGNINLRPETSENTSIGITYTPSWAGGLVARLDYSKLDYIDRISNSMELGQLLPLEEFGNLPEFFERDPNVVYPGTNINVLTRAINTPVNISGTLTETVDLDISYVLDTDYGTFIPGININYVLEQINVPVPGAEEVDRVGTTLGIDEYRVQGRLDWNRGPASGALFLNYTPSYDNVNFEGDVRGFDPVTNPDGIPVTAISSYLTVDASFNYRWGNGLSTRVGARNLLDRDFPFALSARAPYDASRVDLRGRVAFIELSYDFE